MNTIELTQLQTSLKLYIEKFVSTDILFSDAEKEYHKFKNMFESYKKDLNFNSGNYLHSICASHSCENFAKYTGIILLKNDDYNIIASYGSKTINNNLSKIINELDFNNIKNIRQSKSISLTQSLEYTVHYCKAAINENFYLLLSVTSSQFFSYKTFKYFIEIAYRLIDKPVQDESPSSFDYLANVKKRIFKFLDDNSFDKHNFSARLYCFENIPEIFSHMGADSIADIYDRINIKLKRIYSINSLVLQINGNVFAIITSNPKPEIEDVFSFFNVVINYTVKNIPLNKKNDIYGIWG